MNKERLKEIMFDQKEAINSKTNLIERELNVDKYITTSQIVILTGIRRSGKSSMLSLLKEKMNLSDAEFCYFNFDDERVISNISILENLHNLHIEIYGNEPVLFFDEIQNVENWEKFVNRMYEKGAKIFVTGSNAKLLSSEIATSLTGRNKQIELFPFSFNEYLRYHKKSYSLNQLTSKDKALLISDFNSYFETGGFPLVVKENDTELINSYFQDILYRDIISRYRLSQVDEIKQIGLYFASNIGKLFSYSTLQKISGIKSLSSIKDYLFYYEQSYLFFYLKKFDYSVTKQIMNPKKVYTIDSGVIHRLGFNFSANKGRVLENVVYIELLRRGKEVFYHSAKNECDFVIKRGLHITEAIQVTWQLDITNYDREINGLQESLETYGLEKGTLIYMNESGPNLDIPENIELIPVWKWLLSNYFVK
jgi:predicted AAA+ superfamily ATPase